MATSFCQCPISNAKYNGGICAQESFYMFCSFIHTLKENAIPFKGDIQKTDSLIKCLSLYKNTEFSCVGAFNLMHLLFLKFPKEWSLISANVFPKQRHEDSFHITKVCRLVFISKY